METPLAHAPSGAATGGRNPDGEDAPKRTRCAVKGYDFMYYYCVTKVAQSCE